MAGELLDLEALKEHLGPGGPWAEQAGRTVKRLRIERGWSAAHLGRLIGISRTAVGELEAGRIIPRDYLRAATAYVLARDVDDIWPSLSRKRIGALARSLER